MSRKNKVNPDHYKVAGRLAPDDLARERIKQGMAKIATDWDERTKGSTGRTTTQMKTSAAGTKKKPVSTRSAATKPARRAAAGKKTLGSKRTSPATR